MNEQLAFKHQIPTLSILNSDKLFPVHRVYCVGQNYAAHAIEMGSDPNRQSPFFFSKPADAVHQLNEIPFPSMTDNLHHEVECVVVLASGGYNITPEQAEDLIFGYATGVDLTRRDLQAAAKEKGRPWCTSKGFDLSAPVSAITRKKDWQFDASATISIVVNGERRQEAQLNQLIWSIPELLSELSKYYELRAGDVIFTGTPAGVSILATGDDVVASIEGLASCQFKVVS